MLTIYTIFGMMIGFEGYDNGKVYFGVYTPNCEYGYVVTPEEIYLDTIFEKKFISDLQSHFQNSKKYHFPEFLSSRKKNFR